MSGMPYPNQTLFNIAKSIENSLRLRDINGSFIIELKEGIKQEDVINQIKLFSAYILGNNSAEIPADDINKLTTWFLGGKQEKGFLYQICHDLQPNTTNLEIIGVIRNHINRPSQQSQIWSILNKYAPSAQPVLDTPESIMSELERLQLSNNITGAAGARAISQQQKVLAIKLVRKILVPDDVQIGTENEKEISETCEKVADYLLKSPLGGQTLNEIATVLGDGWGRDRNKLSEALVCYIEKNDKTLFNRICDLNEDFPTRGDVPPDKRQKRTFE